MRLYCTLLILILTTSLSAQSKIVGFVKLQSSGNQALANAEVWAIGCASKPERYSNAKGYFELEFPGKKAGDGVREITVSLEGYEVVNKKALENYGLLAQPDDNPLIIVLCQQGNYRKAAAEYYQTIFSAGEAELQAEQKRLQALLEREQQNNELLQQQLAGINAKLENLPQVAEAAADYFAKIDRDQATQLQQNALAELEKGNTQAALDAMPEDIMDQTLASAQQRKQQLEGQLAEANQVIQQSIENYRFKAQLFVSTGDYSAAERLYEKAVLADTAHIENLYDFAVFLEKIKRYDKALLWLQKVTAAKTDAWRIANAWGLMGNVYKETGDFSNALVAYAHFKALCDSLYRQQPEDDFYKSNLAASYGKLGAIYQAQGQFETALVHFQRQTDLIIKLYRDNPKREDLKEKLAVSCGILWSLYREMGNTGKALEFSVKTSNIFRELQKANPKNEKIKKNLIAWYQELGDMYKTQGNLDTALIFLQKGFELSKELVHDNPKSEDLKNALAISYRELGSMYQAQGRFDTALIFLQQGFELSKELYHGNSENENFKANFVISHQRLGDIYQAQKTWVGVMRMDANGEYVMDTTYSPNLDTALIFFQKGFELNKKFVHNNPQNENLKNILAVFCEKLGSIYQEQDKIDSALVYFQKGLKLSKKLYLNNRQNESLKSNLAISYQRLGFTYQAQSKLDSALIYFQQSKYLCEEIHDNNPHNVDTWFNFGTSCYKLGILYAELDSIEQAINYYERSAEVVKDLYELTGLERYQDNYHGVQRELQKLKNSGKYLIYLNRQVNRVTDPAERVRYQEEVLQLLQQPFLATISDRDVFVSGQYGNLAWYYLFTKQFKEAAQAAQQGIALGGAEAEWVHTNLALALLYQGQYEAAHTIYAARKGKPYDEKRTWVEVFLADLAELEAAGITHPDVARVRAFLGE